MTTSKSKDSKDALAFLESEHQAVSDLFDQLGDAESDDDKLELATQICTELAIHAAMEERSFYPVARDALDERGADLLDEATVEHRSLKSLLGEIEGTKPSDDLFEANFEVLEEYVKHHVKEEESQLFPLLRASDLDLEALATELHATKKELMAGAQEQADEAADVVQVPTLGGAGKPSGKPHKRAKASPKKAQEASASTRRGAGH